MDDAASGGVQAQVRAAAGVARVTRTDHVLAVPVVACWPLVQIARLSDPRLDKGHCYRCRSLAALGRCRIRWQ